MLSDVVRGDDWSCPALQPLPPLVADWRGRVWIASLPPFSAIVVHTGRAELDDMGTSATGITLVFVAWALLCALASMPFSWM